MSSLADTVLPLVRTRADLSRWGVANEHGRQMHEAIDVLEAALPTADPAEVYAVVQAALASAVKVIARADDSSGIIGDACRRLLALHPTVASSAGIAPSKLVDWMMKFQFDGDVDYFEIDPVAYAAALGDAGISAYRNRLDAVRATLGPEPAESDRWSVPDRHERWVLDWNDRRLAVLDRDIDAIIRTHARDRKVAAWLQDTSAPSGRPFVAQPPRRGHRHTGHQARSIRALLDRHTPRSSPRLGAGTRAQARQRPRLG